MPGKHWTAEQQRDFLKLYPTHSAREVGEAIGRSTSAVYFRAVAFGLRKSAKQRSEIYRRSMQRFPRGFMREQA